jgi:hypothetical protein
MSSIDITNLKAVTSKTLLTFDFTGIDVYLSNVIYYNSDDAEVKNEPEICNGYRITQFSPPSPSNLSYPDDKHTYRSSDMYITKVIHKVVDDKYKETPYVGEITIKFLPNISTDPKVHLCFFLTNTSLKNSEDKSNDMDRIIDMISSENPDDHINTSLSSVIKPQSAGVLFDDFGDVFILMTNPIYISSDISELNDNKKLFIIDYNSEKLLLRSNNIVMGNDNNVYMECNPTGVSEETIQTYNVPIYSEYSKDISKYTTMNYTINFTSVVAVVFIIYAFFPSFYINYIYENVKKAYGSHEVRATRLTTIDVAFYILVSVFITLNFVIGGLFINDGGWSNILLSFATIFVFILVNSIIGFTRMANVSEAPYSGPFSSFDLNDLLQGGIDFIAVLNTSADRKYWIYWAPILFITSIALLILSATHNWSIPSPNNIKPVELSNYIIMPFYIYLMFLISYVIATSLSNE